MSHANAIRLGLIGAGSHSRGNHVAALARFQREHPGEAELVAVCDLDRERAEQAATRGGFVRVYTDAHAMMRAERLDGCITVMPVDRIVPLALELLPYRVPLMVEKPPGRTPDECAQLRDAAARAAVPVQVSVNRRFQPFLTRGLAWAREQGPLQFIAGTMLRDRRRETDFITGTGIHIIDALRFLGGDVAAYEIVGGSSRPASPRPGLPPTPRGTGTSRLPGLSWGVSTLRFTDGTPGLLTIHPDCGMVAERYELRGEGYSVEIQLGPLCPYEFRCRRENKDIIAESWPPNAPYEFAVGVYEETVAFIDSIRRGGPFAPSPADVYPSMVLAQELQTKPIAG